jgi:argininosuccinate lyase
MPQKRNPLIFEHGIAKVAHLLGAFVSIVTTMKGIPYTHSRATNGEAFTMLWSAFDETKSAVRWATAILKKVEINKDNALKNARSNFSTVTEVADEIVRKMDISFRTAYRIVKKAVLPLYHQGKTSEELTLEELDVTAMDVLGRPLQGITAEDLKKALSPMENIKKRAGPGGPAPTTVSKDIERMRVQLQNDVQQIQSWREKIDIAEKTMKEGIARITESGNAC